MDDVKVGFLRYRFAVLGGIQIPDFIHVYGEVVSFAVKDRTSTRTYEARIDDEVSNNDCVYYVADLPDDILGADLGLKVGSVFLPVV